MARLDAFAREINLATAGLSPAAINPALAAFAKQEVAATIARGEGSAEYTRYVNGIEGLDENQVQAPGPILYVFAWWNPIIAFALDYLEARSPKLTGRYSKSHIAMVKDQPISPGQIIPADAEVIITNRQPYTRKIEVGAMKMRVPPGVYDDARKAVMRRYGNFIDVQIKFLILPLPYILKTDGGKKGRRAGDPLTYPSLVMNGKTFA